MKDFFTIITFNIDTKARSLKSAKARMKRLENDPLLLKQIMDYVNRKLDKADHDLKISRFEIDIKNTEEI